ncbi:MAG TPA: hypothetical protein VF939_07655 [Puia sp.]
MLFPLIPTKSLMAATILYGAALCTGCTHKMAPDGHYQETPVMADGNTGDWSLPLRFSNESYALQYNVTNDNRNIYVCILSRDEATQLRMLRAGMTIYFDPKGDKNKAIGLHFPLRKQPEPDPERARNRNGDPIANNDSKAQKEELLLQSDFYGTTGFSGIENGQFGVADPKSPFQVAMKLNNQDSVLVYEVIIPEKNVLGMDLSARSKKKNFSVGIVLNAVSGQGESRSNGGSRPTFGGGGGGMHMSMGGMHGSHRNYNADGNSPASKEEAIWYPFRLVQK